MHNAHMEQKPSASRPHISALVALCLIGSTTGFILQSDQSGTKHSIIEQAFGIQKAYASEVNWEASDFIAEGDTLYGLSEAGLEKLSATDGELVLPQHSAEGTPLSTVAAFAFRPNKSQEINEYTGREGIGGEVNDLDVDGNKIVDKGANFSSGRIKSLVIPKGYTKIGQDAFAFNKLLSKLSLPEGLNSISDYAFGHCSITSLDLPDSIETIKDQAFFDNAISGELKLPKSLNNLGERVFKSNKISSINFNEAPFTELDEGVFEDNQLKTVVLSNSINKIANDAFNGNPGELSYGSAVVLKTPEGNNPKNLPSLGNYLVDPGDDHKTSELDIDTSTWTNEDFSYDPDDPGIITGFSNIGKLKVRENKELVLPSSNKGVAIHKIAANAFRNVDFDASALRKYDLSSVQIPSTVTEIGAFAFQSNKISELMFDPEDPLESIAEGAFMNNEIEMLVLPSGLKKLGDAAFHINRISMVLIPRELTSIGRSAFRQNTIEYGVGFEEGSKLEHIDEMAFAESNISSVDFSNATQLKSIAVQAFAANELSDLVLPAQLESIGPEAFRSNKLRKLTAPASLASISFNAFDDNPGDPTHGNKVLINLPAELKEHKLANGDNFVVAPNLKASDSSAVKELVDKIETILDEEEAKQGDQADSSLRPEMLAALKELKDEGKALLAKDSISQGEQAQYLFRAPFFLDRLSLDRAIKKADDALGQPKDEEGAKLLSEKLDYVKQHFNNAAWTDEKLARAEHELSLLTDLSLKQGPISKAKMIQGVHELESSLPIPPYFIGFNVYFDPETDKILYVLDRSYSIGAGALDEWGNPILNVDEDNEGYHELAIVTLADYEGKTASEIINHDVDSLGGIREAERAKEHRAGVYAAIKDAASDYLKIKAASAPASDEATPGTAPDTTDTKPNPDKTEPTSGPKFDFSLPGLFSDANDLPKDGASKLDYLNALLADKGKELGKVGQNKSSKGLPKTYDSSFGFFSYLALIFMALFSLLIGFVSLAFRAHEHLKRSGKTK